MINGKISNALETFLCSASLPNIVTRRMIPIVTMKKAPIAMLTAEKNVRSALKESTLPPRDVTDSPSVAMAELVGVPTAP